MKNIDETELGRGSEGVYETFLTWGGGLVKISTLG